MWQINLCKYKKIDFKLTAISFLLKSLFISLSRGIALIAALMSSRLNAVYVISEQMYSSSSAKNDTILFSVN